MGVKENSEWRFLSVIAGETMLLASENLRGLRKVTNASTGGKEAFGNLTCSTSFGVEEGFRDILTRFNADG